MAAVRPIPPTVPGTVAVHPRAPQRARLPQRRFALGALVLVAALTYLIFASFSSAVAAVVTPSQLLHRGAAAYGQTVRLQGRVLGGVQTNATTLAHVFTVSDGHASVQVTYGSDLPGGFKTGASVEGQGTYNGRVFTAYSLTAKCPTKYQAGTTSK
jgi:cytochrome c-type biogenesis protein CcmE